MKKKIILILLIFLGTMNFVFANSVDVLYFKNGNVIRGEIVEFMPNDYLRIMLNDGTELLFNISEIERIVKEQTDKPITKNEYIQKYRGYIGLSFGQSIPVGKYINHYDRKLGTGNHISLINIGYRITDNVGIATSFWVSRIPYFYNDDIFNDEYSYLYSGFFAGPMFPLFTSDNVELDLRTMIGIIRCSKDIEDGLLGFNFGCVFKLNATNSLALLFLGDYLFSVQPAYNSFSMNVFFLGIGIAYRLK